ncbi:hypothetical protein QQX98_009719 [Neonectria punicea]|uniref:L-tryptophan decarboxylase PsiD-like domain-containing protein n=1 Tax=Neonectria punicea TaxID=979145 RepID=A0ABR1GRV9_9HYPO
MTISLIPRQRGDSSLTGNFPPKDVHILTAWLRQFTKDVTEREPLKCLHPAVEDLRILIETTPGLRMLASNMFDEIPNKDPYRHDPVGHRQVRDYRHMLELFSIITTEVAPSWQMTTYNVGLVGAPFNAILDWPMGTQSGWGFFLRQDVNEKLKAILDTWKDVVLKTSKSQYVVTRDKDGWLCHEALAVMERDTNVDGQPWLTFQDMFACDPEGDPVHWGFRSWDDFFVRKFRDMDEVRPVAHPDKPEWVVNAFATRAVIFIRAPKPIGLMCIIFIGMADISTCEIASKFSANLPQTVRKGEELGMFHHGGSSHCLLFRKGLKLAWAVGAIPGKAKKNLPIRNDHGTATNTELGSYGGNSKYQAQDPVATPNNTFSLFPQPHKPWHATLGAIRPRTSEDVFQHQWTRTTDAGVNSAVTAVPAQQGRNMALWVLVRMEYYLSPDFRGREAEDMPMRRRISLIPTAIVVVITTAPAQPMFLSRPSISLTIAHRSPHCASLKRTKRTKRTKRHSRASSFPRRYAQTQ